MSFKLTRSNSAKALSKFTVTNCNVTTTMHPSFSNLVSVCDLSVLHHPTADAISTSTKRSRRSLSRSTSSKDLNSIATSSEPSTSPYSVRSTGSMSPFSMRSAVSCKNITGSIPLEESKCHFQPISTSKNNSIQQQHPEHISTLNLSAPKRPTPSPSNNNFSILRTQSLGSLGEVIIVNDNDTNTLAAIQTVKIKSHSKTYCTGPNNDLIPSEIYLLQQLDHPNIISYKSHSFTGSNWLLVLEFNPKWVTLTTLLQQSFGGLSEANVWFIIQQLLNAVSHCIHRGVDHRAITPDNILIDHTTLEIKLFNFSLATELSQVVPYSSVAGEANVFPPEWFSRGFYQPIQGLVWSLGLLMFEMACGKKAVSGFNDKGINWNQLANARIPVSGMCLDLLVGCLEKNPEKRIVFSKLCRHPWVANETDM